MNSFHQKTDVFSMLESHNCFHLLPNLIETGSIVYFQINVGCSRSFSYHHPVLLQYSHDAGMSWEMVEKPCYVRDSCHHKYTEGSVYYTGTHGHWVLVILPLPKHVVQK